MVAKRKGISSQMHIISLSLKFKPSLNLGMKTSNLYWVQPIYCLVCFMKVRESNNLKKT